MIKFLLFFLLHSCLYLSINYKPIFCKQVVVIKIIDCDIIANIGNIYSK